MSNIKSLVAREILDSRGIPTIEAIITLEDGKSTIASIPSGTSMGAHEAVELRDNDPDRYQGKGVLKAINIVNKQIAPNLIGKDPDKQTEIDQMLINLDGTENKSKLGANSILAASQAVCEIGALNNNLPIYQYIYQKYQLKAQLKIPIPTFNIINGGKHGAGNLEFQEFHIIPSSRYSYSAALQMGEEIYQLLGQQLAKRGAIHSVGVEGGYAPNLFTNSDALEIITETIELSPHKLGQDIHLGLDVAATHFHQDNKYQIKDAAHPLSTQQMIDFYKELNERFHLFSLEDPLHEEKWRDWITITKLMGQNTLIVADDLLTTSPKLIQKAIKEKACNAILIKPNQIGTISETIQVIAMAQKAGWAVIVSHRSGETNDDFIADFAVGVCAEYTKFGAPARGERVAKYNRLLQIESELGISATSPPLKSAPLT